VHGSVFEENQTEPMNVLNVERNFLFSFERKREICFFLQKRERFVNVYICFLEGGILANYK